MPRPAVLLTALLGLTVPVASAQAADCALPAGPLPTRTRAVFVLDTSGSMRGLGDGRADIFRRVTAALNTYVRATRPDRVDLLTFDAGLRSHRAFDAPAGTAAWNGALAALHADGKNTHLYRSLHDALAPLSGAATYLTTVFVLTDGIDNDPEQSVTPAQALAAFGGRGPLDRLHYVALGTGIPAAARQALSASTYADGLTLPVGRVPDLVRLGHGGGLLRVTDAAHLRVPFAAGGPVTLGTGPAGTRLRVTAPRPDGTLELTGAGRVPAGTPALLCAAPLAEAGAVAPRPARVLLRLTLPGAPGLHLLNPGADRTLAAGEDVVLRYHAPAGLSLSGVRLLTVPAGLRGEVWHAPGSRDVAVRLTNVGLPAGRSVTPSVLLPGGAVVALPAVHGAAGGTALAPTGAGSRGATRGTPGRWLQALLWGLAALLVLGAVVAALRRPRPGGGTRRRPTPPVPAAFPDVPAVEGIEYSEDRLLSLVGAAGEVTGVSTPLDGPFDLGHLARVPHLSGLRFEQHRHGLRCVQIPDDLEVSQGTRLLRSGDIVQPGTLLGVAVARPARAPDVPLGSLSGLGLPLTLRTQGHTVHAAGPYGEHAVTLHAGITDLGDALDAPALRGLRVAVTGHSVLLAELPDTLGLRRPGEGHAITPGTALTGTVTLDLPGESGTAPR